MNKILNKKRKSKEVLKIEYNLISNQACLKILISKIIFQKCFKKVKKCVKNNKNKIK